jgi:hypothetical protein
MITVGRIVFGSVTSRPFSLRRWNEGAISPTPIVIDHPRSLVIATELASHTPAQGPGIASGFGAPSTCPSSHRMAPPQLTPHRVDLLDVGDANVKERARAVGIRRRLKRDGRLVVGGPAPFVEDQPSIGHLHDDRVALEQHLAVE